MIVPEIYYSQALKPRGNNVNEKLSFLADWYLKCDKVEPSDQHQKRFLSLMVDWGKELKKTSSEPENSIRSQIQNLLSTISSPTNDYLDDPASKAFMSYLYIELSRVIE